MSEQTAKPVTELWVERTATRRYTGRSTRGAEVLIGSEDVEGVFTPGELLKIALAGCAGLSADFRLSHRLGDNFDATIRVSGNADRETETYPALVEEFELDLSELEPEARERLLTATRRAIDRVCTVGRTLKQGTTVNLRFVVDS